MPPINILLPDVETVPPKYRGKTLKVMTLLGDGDSNPKLAKSNAGSAKHRYKTFGLSLAPSIESGFQTCASASDGCSAACLYFQGQSGSFSNIKASRIAKTIAFFEHRDWFEARLRREITHADKVCRQAGFRMAFRPNVTSDIMWERIFPWMFTEFPTVTSYDYSAHYRRVIKHLQGGGFPNYHLTFSRKENNHDECLRVLEAGGNVAVVFRTPELPTMWEGYPVINGDETDMRFADPRNVVVGLKAKGTAKHDESGFVVENNRVSLQLV